MSSLYESVTPNLTLKYMNIVSDAIRLQDESITNYTSALAHFQYYANLNPDSPYYQIWLSMISTTKEAIQNQLNAKAAYESVEFKLVHDQVKEGLRDLTNLLDN